MSAVLPAVKSAEVGAQRIAFGAMLAFFLLGPALGMYPVFLMKVMCFALFACAFNLLIGFGGLLSFGHAMFLGSAGYMSAHAAKVWGLTPELAILAGTATAALLGFGAGLLGLGVLRREEAARSTSPIELQLMRAVTQALAPRGLMNPGKSIGD